MSLDSAKDSAFLISPQGKLKLLDPREDFSSPFPALRTTGLAWIHFGTGFGRLSGE